MRVISKANGDLLDGHSGSYVWGGSWFLNDGANYLDGLIHGMDPEDLDKRLLWGVAEAAPGGPQAPQVRRPRPIGGDVGRETRREAPGRVSYSRFGERNVETQSGD